MKTKLKPLPLRDAFHIALLAFLLFLKTRSFYSALHLGGFHTAFAFASTAIFLAFYALMLVLNPKFARIAANVLYIVISIVMGVDSVYYAYTTKLPSVTQVGMAWQIPEVSDTVLSLLRVRHLMLIADLPIWVFLYVNRDLISDKLSRTKAAPHLSKLAEVSWNRIASAVLCFLLACVVGMGAAFWPDFEPEYMENEVFTYHAMDIMKALDPKAGEREVDKSKYASPDWSSSKYFGLAEGRNVIIIQVEALQNFVIGREYRGQELTPNLNAMIADSSIYFDNYYYQIGGANTADAEFAVNNSLFAPEADGAYVRYTDNHYYSLAYLLKDHGYSTAHAFHGYTGVFWNRETAYPYQGFDDFTSLEDLEQTDMFPMGLSDREFFRQSMDWLETFEEPFYAMYVTVSSHHPYAIPLKDREIELAPEDEETLFGLYMQASNYVDRAIGEFMEELKEAGLYDNSIILIYGDHYALTNTSAENSTRVSALTGSDYTIFDVFNVPLIIHIPGSGVTEVNHIAGGHMDVEPTLLCLLGLTNDKSVMFGQNLLEAESGFVCEQAHVSIGSFISDSVFYQKPHNNIKSNYAVYDKATMARLEPDDFTALSDLAASRIQDCAALLAKDDVFLD